MKKLFKNTLVMGISSCVLAAPVLTKAIQYTGNLTSSNPSQNLAFTVTGTTNNLVNFSTQLTNNSPSQTLTVGARITNQSGGTTFYNTSATIAAGQTTNINSQSIMLATGNYYLALSTNFGDSSGSVFYNANINQGAGSAPVPEPFTIISMGAGLFGLIKKRRKQS